MALSSPPSAADYGSLVALVAVVDGFYISDARMAKVKRRLGGGRFLVLVLAPSAFTAVLLALAPNQRYLAWWIPVLQLGPPALVATISTPISLLARRRSWPLIQPHERRIATVTLTLIVAAALTAPIGTAVLTIVSGDFRLALSLSLAIAFLLRWAWVLIVRRRFPRPVPAVPVRDA